MFLSTEITITLKLKIYYPILPNSRNLKLMRISNLIFLFNSEKKLKDIVKPLHQKECLTKKECDRIYPTGSRPGIFYGSAKVHKPVIDNCSFFLPIWSSIGTPMYNLVNFVTFNSQWICSLWLIFVCGGSYLFWW